MHPGVSLYLDVFRFGLALIVTCAHASSRTYTGGFLWQSGAFSQPAVIGFFVLSGYVISFVASERESAAPVFLSSRLSRLYSVIVPALILTALLDAIGWHYATAFYESAPLDIGLDYPVVRYILTLLMINNLGIVGVVDGTFEPTYVPGTNGPFWSMT